MEIIIDKKRWNAVLDQHFSMDSDIYFRHEYFELYTKNFGVDSECIFWQDENISIFLPHLVRKIRHIPFFSDSVFLDLTSPYGYSGPLMVSETNDMIKQKLSLKKFKDEYFRYAQDCGYISEFIRFHPFYPIDKLFHEICSVKYVNDVIIVDLRQDIKTIWEKMNGTTRRYIKKSEAEFSLISCTQKPSEAELLAFDDLYNKTMEKQSASQKYFFDSGFIRDHFSLFSSVLISCKNQIGEIGSIGIFLKGDRILHYHLGSTNYSSSASPLRTVLWHAIQWGKANHCDFLHLGGGRGINDTLFQFKKGFSEDARPFSVGMLVFNDAEYQRHSEKNPNVIKNGQFFPQYRQGTEKNIIE